MSSKTSTSSSSPTNELVSFGPEIDHIMTDLGIPTDSQRLLKAAGLSLPTVGYIDSHDIVHCNVPRIAGNALLDALHKLGARGQQARDANTTLRPGFPPSPLPIKTLWNNRIDARTRVRDGSDDDNESRSPLGDIKALKDGIKCAEQDQVSCPGRLSWPTNFAELAEDTSSDDEPRAQLAILKTSDGRQIFGFGEVSHVPEGPRSSYPTSNRSIQRTADFEKPAEEDASSDDNDDKTRAKMPIRNSKGGVQTFVILAAEAGYSASEIAKFDATVTQAQREGTIPAMQEFFLSTNSPPPITEAEEPIQVRADSIDDSALGEVAAGVIEAALDNIVEIEPSASSHARALREFAAM